MRYIHHSVHRRSSHPRNHNQTRLLCFMHHPILEIRGKLYIRNLFVYGETKATSGFSRKISPPLHTIMTDNAIPIVLVL